MKTNQFLLPIFCCLLLLSLTSKAQKFTENGTNNYLKETCYLALKQQMPLGSFLMFTNMASDDSKAGGGPYDNFFAFDNFTIKANDGYIEQLWTRYYQGIAYCNNLIDYTSTGTTNIDQYRAEAFFMRAFFYFDLVKIFAFLFFIYPIIF